MRMFVLMNALTGAEWHGPFASGGNLIPGDAALRGGHPNCAAEGEGVRRSSQHGAAVLDSKHDFVACLETQRVPYGLEHGHLSLGTHSCRAVHVNLPTLRKEVGMTRCDDDHAPRSVGWRVPG